jgi:hypothetical protein
MRRCRPAPAFCVPKTLPCGETLLCPFCAARAGLKVWRRIDAKLFPVPPGKKRQVPRRDDRVLVTRVLSYRVDAGDHTTLKALIATRTGDAARDCDLETRARAWADLKRLGAVGGLESLHVRPLLGHSPGPNQPTRLVAYRVEFHQVLLFPPGVDVETLDQLEPRAWFPRTRRTVRLGPVVPLTRRTLVDATSLALRYDRMALTIGRAVMTLYLTARRGRRCSATFGELHAGTG